MLEISPTDILRKEHELVLELLNKLEKALQEKDTNLLKENIYILDREFDKHSLNKEEKAVFPEIEKFIPRDGGPTGMMIIEHKDIVEWLNNSKKFIEPVDFESVGGPIRNILNVLRPHIDKENNILFMMAEMHFDDKQKEVILEKFEKIDKDLI